MTVVVSMSVDWESILLPSIKERIRGAMEGEVKRAVAEFEQKLRGEIIKNALETAVSIQRFVDKKGDQRITVDVRLVGSPAKTT